MATARSTKMGTRIPISIFVPLSVSRDWDTSFEGLPELVGDELEVPGLAFVLKIIQSSRSQSTALILEESHVNSMESRATEIGGLGPLCVHWIRSLCQTFGSRPEAWKSRSWGVKLFELNLSTKSSYRMGVRFRSVSSMKKVKFDEPLALFGKNALARKIVCSSLNLTLDSLRERTK